MGSDEAELRGLLTVSFFEKGKKKAPTCVRAYKFSETFFELFDNFFVHFAGML